MILKAGKKLLLLGFVWSITFVSFSQITSGRIVFERKTNLKKRFGDNPRMKDFITEDNKYRIENFELYFNDSTCVFRPLPEEDAPQGFLRFLTSKNTVYQDLSKREKFIIMDMWGNETFLRDTMDNRKWKVTESKRKICGYMCRKAIWEMNDSTRIYAWFSPDIVPTIGPEGFGELPGAILGLATEDGGVIYFAKEVVAMEPPAGVFNYETKGKDVYTEAELKVIIQEKMGQWIKPHEIEAMFSWI